MLGASVPFVRSLFVPLIANSGAPVTRFIGDPVRARVRTRKVCAAQLVYSARMLSLTHIELATSSRTCGRLHVARRLLHVARRVAPRLLHVAQCGASPVACGASPVACGASPVACGASSVACGASPAACGASQYVAEARLLVCAREQLERLAELRGDGLAARRARWPPRPCVKYSKYRYSWVYCRYLPAAKPSTASTCLSDDEPVSGVHAELAEEQTRGGALHLSWLRLRPSLAR